MIEKLICTCSRFPNQFEGIVDGKPFYFRARHGEWYLRVNEEVVAEGCGESEPDGSMDPAEAEVFVRKQLELYSAQKCPHCGHDL